VAPPDFPAVNIFVLRSEAAPSISSAMSAWKRSYQ
jgi:hypothetical protein